jgi:hypothetical protein
MNNADPLLQKLLDGASRAESTLPQAPPFAVESRVLAHWRSGRKEDESALLLWFFQRAAIVAIVIMMLSGVINYLGTPADTGTTGLASYAMMQLTP